VHVQVWGGAKVREREGGEREVGREKGMRGRERERERE